jgi:SIR2-like domain
MPKTSNSRETRRESDSEEFWDDLLAYMDDKCVVPVVGPELLTVVIDGREVPLYRAVAGRDASNVDSDIDNQVGLRPHSELYDAVSALVENEYRLKSLYRPINSELRELLDGEPKIPSALCKLAQITDFSLFVTTTPDDLLVRAIKAARPDIGKVQTVAYAPNLTTSQKEDLPEIARPDYTCVFHMFGQASSSPMYAVCEEDVLECIYGLQVGDGPPPGRMLAKLRDSNLLLIGCNFTDWLSRFFLRLSNRKRLSDGRDKGATVLLVKRGLAAMGVYL